MKRLCVYCGSSSGSDSAFAEAAAQVGGLLAKHSIELVYGGGSSGLMGVLADAVLAAGGRVTGIIPAALYEKEIAHKRCTELFVVASMHERKTMMAALADGFAALPGGFGTLEEFVEVLTWAQLGFHKKPCVLLNTGGFYNTLIEFFDQMVVQGFLRPRLRHLVLSVGTPHELMETLEHYTPIGTDKWLEKEDL